MEFIIVAASVVAEYARAFLFSSIPCTVGFHNLVYDMNS